MARAAQIPPTIAPIGDPPVASVLSADGWLTVAALETSSSTRSVATRAAFGADGGSSEGGLHGIGGEGGDVGGADGGGGSGGGGDGSGGDGDGGGGGGEAPLTQHSWAIAQEGEGECKLHLRLPSSKLALAPAGGSVALDFDPGDAIISETAAEP